MEFLAAAFFHTSPHLFALAAKMTGMTQTLALLHVANSRFKPVLWPSVSR